MSSPGSSDEEVVSPSSPISSKSADNASDVSDAGDENLSQAYAWDNIEHDENSLSEPDAYEETSPIESEPENDETYEPGSPTDSQYMDSPPSVGPPPALGSPSSIESPSSIGTVSSLGSSPEARSQRSVGSLPSLGEDNILEPSSPHQGVDDDVSESEAPEDEEGPDILVEERSSEILPGSDDDDSDLEASENEEEPDMLNEGTRNEVLSEIDDDASEPEVPEDEDEPDVLVEETSNEMSSSGNSADYTAISEDEYEDSHELSENEDEEIDEDNEDAEAMRDVIDHVTDNILDAMEVEEISKENLSPPDDSSDESDSSEAEPQRKLPEYEDQWVSEEDAQRAVRSRAEGKVTESSRSSLLGLESPRSMNTSPRSTKTPRSSYERKRQSYERKRPSLEPVTKKVKFKLEEDSSDAELSWSFAENDLDAQNDGSKVDVYEPILRSIKIENLPKFALEIISKLSPDHPATRIMPTLEEYIKGSNHIVFPLFFNDEFRCIFKIPINGYDGKWDQLSANALESEAKTMCFLQDNSGVPLPLVYAYDMTPQNTLGCPFIFMEYIDGLSLYDVWFGHHIHGESKEIVAERRKRALDEISSAMMELGRFKSNMVGRPLFDDKGYLAGAGSYRLMDIGASVHRTIQEQNSDPVYIECEPTSNVNQTFWLDRYFGQNDENVQDLDIDMEEDISNKVFEGLIKLLRKMINWIPIDGDDTTTLTHPDFDIGNFIVTQEGELLAIIDWDGVLFATGNESYPGWLTRDWDTTMYKWEPCMENGEKPEGDSFEVWEDSPETLASYRAVYNNMMDMKRQKMKVPDHKISFLKNCKKMYRSVLASMDKSGYGKGLSRLSIGYYFDFLFKVLARIRGKKQDLNPTHMSLITDNLAMAARTPQNALMVCHKIVQECWDALDRQKAEAGEQVSPTHRAARPDALELADMIVMGEMDPALMEELKVGFLALIFSENL